MKTLFFAVVAIAASVHAVKLTEDFPIHFAEIDAVNPPGQPKVTDPQHRIMVNADNREWSVDSGKDGREDTREAIMEALFGKMQEEAGPSKATEEQKKSVDDNKKAIENANKAATEAKQAEAKAKKVIEEAKEDAKKEEKEAEKKAAEKEASIEEEKNRLKKVEQAKKEKEDEAKKEVSKIE